MFPQPSREPGSTGAAQPIGGLIPGEQDQRGLALAVVEGAFQRREVFQQLSAQPVDRPGAVGHQIGAPGRKDAQLHRDVIPSPQWCDQYDVGQATMAMMIAATDLGIGTGHSSVGDPDKARAILGVPDDYQVAYLLGIGYPADRPLKPIRKPNRRPFDEVVHHGHW